MTLPVDLDVAFLKPFVFWVEGGTVIGKENTFLADIFRLMVYRLSIITELVVFYKLQSAALINE